MSKVVCEQIEFSAEQSSDPGNPASGKVVLFTKDNGSGKTQIGLRYSNGATVILSTQSHTNQVPTQSFRGLMLGRLDNVANDVKLYHADEIVMHDGERISDWNNLNANITTSGAGGLDTGSEQSSTWYEIYAIRKSADGTKNLLLHRAKNYTADQTQASSDASEILREGATNSIRLAQGFQLSTTAKVEAIKIGIDRQGSPTGNFWVTIEADSSGNPSGTPLATSALYDVAALTPTGGFCDVLMWFPNPTTLSSATQYHIVLYGDYTVSGTNYLRWYYKNTTNPYANGSAKQYDNTSWAAVGTTADFRFTVYITENDTALTLPSGYDQYCLIGHCYNSSGSVIKAFIQKDRRVTANGNDWKVGTQAGAGNGPILTDLRAFVPPLPVLVRFGAAGSTSSLQESVGPITSLTGVSGGANEHGWWTAAATAVAHVQTVSDAVPIFLQHGNWYAHATFTSTLWVCEWEW